MLYTIKFKLTGSKNQEQIENLKQAVMDIEGVKEIRISGGQVSVTYDPTKVIPSVLSSVIGSKGAKVSGG